MKLRLQVLLISMALVLGTSAMVSVVLEYAMSLETKNEIQLAERKRQEEIAAEAARKAEAEAKELERAENLKTYDSAEDYYNGLALVKRDGKYGYIDYNGKEVIPLEFEFANNFTNKYSKVKKDGKWGYIDTTGNAIIPIEYAYCGEVSNGIVAVGNGGKYGFIAIDGTVVCELIYDKVEPFNTEGIAKVVVDQKYGYIDKNNTVIVPITTRYEEENADFTGEWHGTETHSSRAGRVVINGQIATSFNFEIYAKYFTKTGSFSGTAEIVKPNMAEYKYSNGGLTDTINFSIVDGNLVITSKTGGSCGMDNDLTAVGTYTLDVPKYTNDNVMERVFDNDEKLYARIKAAIGEELYGTYFLYGFKNGEYTIKELYDVSDVIKGKLYTVTVPTLEKDFKLLVSKEHIYFFAKGSEIYRSDDLDRQTLGKMPSALSFDEL